MKFLLFIILTVVVTSCKQASRVNTKTSKLENKEWLFIMEERKLCYSHLSPCDSINATFHYLNNTDSVQLIDTVKTSCSCTHIRYSHTPIKPGDKGDIEMTVMLKNDSGFFSKAACVYFHGQRPVLLRVQGTISN